MAAAAEWWARLPLVLQAALFPPIPSFPRLSFLLYPASLQDPDQAQNSRTGFRCSDFTFSRILFAAKTSLQFLDHAIHIHTSPTRAHSLAKQIRSHTHRRRVPRDGHAVGDKCFIQVLGCSSAHTHAHSFPQEGTKVSNLSSCAGGRGRL